MLLNKAIKLTQNSRPLISNPSIAAPSFLSQTTIFNTSTNTNATRSKHSKRQLKRLFQRHPAALRVRNATSPEPEPPLDPKYQAFFTPTILPNGWSEPPSSENVEVVKKRDELPFGIKRTGNKPNDAVGFLPVYSKFGSVGTRIFYSRAPFFNSVRVRFKHRCTGKTLILYIASLICIYYYSTYLRLGGSKQTTIIRKITGNKEIFVEELMAALSISPDDQGSIVWRASGTKIELKGNRTWETKAWLAGLGF